MKTERCEVCDKTFKEDFVFFCSSQYAPTSFMRCKLCNTFACEPESLQYMAQPPPLGLLYKIFTKVMIIRGQENFINAANRIKIRDVNTFDIYKNRYQIIDGCESEKCKKSIEDINTLIAHPTMSLESFDEDMRTILEDYKKNVED